MRKVILAVLLLAVLIAAQQASAQADEIQLKRFRVLLVTGDRIDGHDGVLSATELRGLGPKKSQLTVPRENIRALQRYGGTKMMKGMWIGAACGALSFLAVYVAVELDPDKEVNKDRVVPVFLGSTVIGGLIGAAVGSSMTSWHRVPLETGIQFNPENSETKLVISLSF